ncbi:MAG: LysM peptidoglycan-binding domain-containing protein [Bacteroidetes bacterium]|nr:LysM peptidoglycan-binding domain-containing protein [Bacteroidota bacterium]
MYYIYIPSNLNQKTNTMKCPLCEHEGLDASVKNCPSCNADLTAYHALDSIKASAKKQKTTTLVFIILFILALLACIAIFFAVNSGVIAPAEDQELLQSEATVLALQAENQQLKSKIAELQTENTNLLAREKEVIEVEEFRHIIIEGETLYGIAQKYLGNGDLYPKIASDNGIKDVNLIQTGHELIIYIKTI